ncbi:hypothetical protein PLICRDRAFT_43906 [Plicaturopsis crispa FD-325 SS-3]|nr:hypothetical protein PLICRDRAFT_43906 [Plicaturopsis crispa FD-325 SS-3]
MYDEDSVEWYHFPISPELSLAMHASLPEEGIFPNLHTLKLPWTELVQFLCSPAPHLRSLTICVNQYFLPIGPELRLPAMLSFPSYCPNVKNFVVAFEGLGDYPRSAVPVDMACEWAGLTNLLLLLAKFDDLQKLSRRLHNVRQLGFFWEDTIPESPSKPRSLPFLHLRNLKMAMIIREHGGSVGYNILDALEVPELEVLSLFLLRRPTSSGWLLPSLFTSLSSLNPASMRTIHFEELTRSPHNPHNSLRRETMQPLFSCRYITVFRWTCTDGFDLDDGDLGVLAASWPSLRLLDLSAGIDWATPSRLTLHGLVKLVQLCPCLESLGIVIDAADVVLADFAAYTTPNTVFENLNVGNSPITDVEAVGTVLARVIPCVHNITARKSSGLGTEAARFMLRWMEVGQLINPSMLPIENY